MTWEQRYGTKKSNEMKAKRAANRKKPRPLTTFMRHHGLQHPLTETEAEAEAIGTIHRLGSRVGRVNARGPYR